MREARRLRTVVVALGVMLAVAGCDGPPAGAEGTLKDMAALEIMSIPPPEGVWVASAEELGWDGIAAFNPPYVTVVYATSATVAEVDEYYISRYPTYDFDLWGSYDPMNPPLGLHGHAYSSADGDVIFDIGLNFDAPDYDGGGGPVPGPAPKDANLYVVVEAFWFKPTDH